MTALASTPEPAIPDPGHEAVRLFARHAFAATTAETNEYYWRRFSEWCDANGTDPLPSTEQWLLRYLHSQYPYWGWGSMWAAVNAIVRVHQHHWLDSPAGPRVRAYLSCVRRDKGTTVEPYKIDPVRGRDLAAIASRPPAPRRRVEQRRVALALVAHHGTPVAALARALGRDFDGGTRRLQLPGGISLAVVDTLAGRVADLAIDSGPDGHLFGPRLARELGYVAYRAGIGGLDRGTVAANLAWLSGFSDPGYVRRTRDLAYLAVGFANAHRAADLARLDLRDCTWTPDGSLIVTLRRSKTDTAGRGRTFVLEHLDLEHPACPACRVRAWIDLIDRRFAYRAGALFPSRLYVDQPPRGRIATVTGRSIVRRLWDEAGLPPTARIGSRSLRAGAATTAHEAGMQLPEIAKRVTDHLTLDNLERYIRHHDPFTADYQLPV